jgi:hypothetical protein
MARHKDANWSVPDNPYCWEQAMVAVLMDIRDELKALNRTLNVLRCPNFLAIPRTLEQIRANTSKPKAKRAKLRPVA